ncbi:hypothetical protein KC340_g13622 [Hortaea werneckii]|nr:hypothetical protein KC342_g9796 [Hortaea werneckii]KAI7094487.1 hypothetical protein KC339_g11575 [Hortaea werneckii]KAI7223427.1 hypothetical protein KC365_g11138 [Hortaea werneckii]KAI7299832.1 hypothetical protein KC340_g13622 [Hortaea werneckii]KAI7349162.1 hypothetical protein KC354_g13335 [Hortaea werneckii]
MTNPLSKLSEVFHHHDRDQESPTVPSESQVYPGSDEAKAQYRARQVAQDAQLSSVQMTPGAPSGDAPPPPYAPPSGLPPDMSAKAGSASEKPLDASDTSAPLNGYPRPDFHRTVSDLVWHSLNGPWDFVFDDTDTGLSDFWYAQPRLPDQGKRTIQVPYVFQCAASGIDERGVHEVLWYQRQIQDLRSSEAKERGDRLLLRCGAIDYHATIWLNGRYVGEHTGGHVPFDLDLSDAVALSGYMAENTLTIRVYDSAFDVTQPRGKQYWGPKPESIFYTPSSGIWQNVWLEVVPRMRVVDGSYGTILRSNDIEKGVVDARVAVQGRRAQEKCSVEVEASFYGIPVSKSGKKDLNKSEDFVRFDLPMRLSQEALSKLPAALLQDAPLKDPFCWRNNTALWSPEHPALYDLTIRLYNSTNGEVIDAVQTTTGMRSITWTHGDGTLRLNSRPYFQALFLDQGYWPSTLLTPPDPTACKRDIQLSKAVGFNGCRKHQKVESPEFLYWADRLGFLVWGEMASPYNFSMTGCERFEAEWMAMIRRDLNHPSIVAWTPCNESWGYPDLGGSKRQRDHLRSLVYKTKTLDPSRPVNDNCGWEHVCTDLSTFHDYADARGMRERCGDLQATLTRGKNMFLPAIQGRDGGEDDEGSRHMRGAPVFCSEMGGVNIAVKNDDSRQGNWGYTTASDGQDLLRRLEELLMATVSGGHVCGIVWTQTTDIEQEMNGIYTWDRREKMPAAQVAEVMDRVKKVYYDGLRKHW